MKKLWVHRDIGAPPATVWELLTDPHYWSEWGPTVREADVHGDRLQMGARGTVTTVAGVDLPFEITNYDEGSRWEWKVGGVPATDHTVEPSGPDSCRVGFGVPWPAAPYLAFCRLALERLEKMATAKNVTS
ncbi:MAG: SRPBCC family protein [Acidimicrobiales bacterium]